MRSRIFRRNSSLSKSTRLTLAVMAGLCALGPAGAQTTPSGSHTARSLITEEIDSTRLVALHGNVRADLTADRDLGPVEDELQMRLFLVLKRSPEQQADLDNLIARQQQPTAAEYHQWLTPQQFGERFGVSEQDIVKITAWLESQGLRVNGVLNNAMTIDVSATAAQVRSTFHTELHYYNIRGGRYPANAQDPQIPAGLAPVVGGIKGLSKIPAHSKRTPGHPVSYDASTHRWLEVRQAPGEQSKDNAGGGSYNVTPQDFYTIYNVNPIFAVGNLGAGSSIGLPEPSDMEFGTVNKTTGAATGGDVATFRTLFGVPGTLNMTVMHGAGTVTCADPGITDAVGEAALDAEWANAVAPSAHLIFMACDSTSVGDGFTTALAALIDNNISDVISSSYGNSEAVISASDFAFDDLLANQAAAQGQSFIDAAGDAGSADADQNTKTTAVKGLNVDQFAAHPLITSVGGTDFSDNYDSQEGGPAQSTYWGATNSHFYGDALGYIPETPWNSSCADSIIANLNGFEGAGYCASLLSFQIDGTVVGGGGGFSAHYAQPSYQAGTPGLSPTATKRAGPDIAFFAANGFWSHAIIECDSSSPTTACTSPTTFEAAGGTSFTAPQFAGVTALLVTFTGERQGTLNPALYALAKAQYANPATATACYSNGQTNNIGVTTGRPAAECIFNDVTTGNNDEPCQAGSLGCYVNPGAKYGVLSITGASSLTVGFASGVGYDETTGLGSVNIANLINNWKSAFTSTTGLVAAPLAISAIQSTVFTATVTIGTPTGYLGTPPPVTGSISFRVGPITLGTCTLSAGTCSLTVTGTQLQPGPHSVTATFLGSGTYPASTSNIVTVTVGGAAQTITFPALPNVTYGVNPITLTATASSGLPVSYTVTGPATVAGSTLTITGAGTVTVTASQAGNSIYAAASSVSQFTVAKATLTVTANNASRAPGAANPVFTYKITGFVNGDTTAAVGGTATETTTATTTSAPGSYPITFSVESLTAANYTFTYVNGTLTITGGASGLTISTTGLSYGVVNTAYSQTLTASGGTAPYTWKLAAGRLPFGLTLNSATGVISGTPTSAESGSVLTFQVTDASNPSQMATATFVIVISTTPISLQIATTSLNNGVVGVPYSQTLAASGGTGPYTWLLISGTLPQVLTLSSGGVIAGTPAAPVSALPLTFKVTDSSTPPQSATASFTLTITTQSIGPLTITTTALNSGVVGTAYTQALTATGGTAPYTWKLTAGRLPFGLAFNSATGVISGTPTSAVAGSVLTFQVTDSSNPPQTVTASYAITIGLTP